MTALSYVRTCALAGALVLPALPMPDCHQFQDALEASRQAAAPRDGQHDFDFEFGTWKVHLRRLLQPLTGSNTWVDLEGTSTVRRVWDGRANLGELEVENATTRIEGLSLRLYDPESRQWSIHWANANDGRLGLALVGQFTSSTTRSCSRVERFTFDSSFPT